MQLYRRPNSPYYYVNVVDAGGKRVRKSTGETDKRAATKVAAKMLAEAQAEADLARDGKLPIKLADALEDYAAWLRLQGKTPGANVADTALRKTLGRMDGRFGLDPTLWLHDLTCGFRLKPARYSEVKPATVPI